VAAVALAGLGQQYFFHRREYLWDGLILHLLAGLCFLVAWQLGSAPAEDRPRRRRFTLGAWIRQRSTPAVLSIVALFFSLTAALLVRGRGIEEETLDVVTVWLLGLAALMLATVWPTSWPPRQRRRARQLRLDTDQRAMREGRLGQLRAKLHPFLEPAWLEAITVTGLTFLALILRVAGLAAVPYVIGGDEAWHGLLARQVFRGALQNPFQMGYMSMPTAFYWPLSWSLWLAGNDVFALRLPAALVGAATVPLLYLLARSLWGRRVAFLATAFLVAYDYHLHYSRLGANNVWDPFFVTLVLWAVDRGLAALAGQEEAEKGQDGLGQAVKAQRWFVLAGMVMGLSTLFYTGARLLPLLVGAYAGFVWLRRGRRLEGLGLGLLLLVLAFLVAAGPMLSYALSHPDEWNARVNQVGIFQSGWLEREPEITGKSTAQILAEQFLRSAGAFHAFADRTVWYGADRPLLGYLPGLFAVLGMAWAVGHWRERRYFLVLLWFWSVIISGGMLTESPPSSQRLVIAIPAVVLLVALGMEQAVRLAWRLLVLDRRWADLLLGLLVLVLMAGSVRFYFVEYTPQRRYGSTNGEIATMMGHYLQTLDRDYEAYLFGAPNLYWGFGTMKFLAPWVQGEDVVEPLDGPPDLLEEGQRAVFLFLPERREELAWVEEAYPSGEVFEFYSPQRVLRFVAYQVPSWTE
jgi:4-amino-4-deoxy-L-arabinose transferase-like glycosyltransferase